MRVQNEIDRFHLVEAAVNALPQLGNKGAYLLQKMRDTLVAHKQYISEYGMDLSGGTRLEVAYTGKTTIKNE